jgi:AraC-like DNA-binding protein
MYAINFIGIGLAFFLSSMLIIKKEKGNFDYILLAYLMLNGINLFFIYLNFIEQTEQYVPLLVAMGLIPFLVSPLLYIYVSSLVQGTKFSWYWQITHFIPYIIILMSMYWVHWSNNDTSRLIISHGFINVGGDLPFHLRNWSLIMAFVSFTYPVMCLVKLFRHRVIIENEFSSLKNNTLDWMRYWIIIEIIGFWITFIILLLSGYEDSMFEYITSFKVVSIIIILNIFVVGYFGIKQSNIFVGSGINEDSKMPKEKYRSSNLGLNKKEELMLLLRSKMDSDKPYIKSTLNAKDVAKMIEVTNHQLSQLINQETDKNFYEFVNQYRVEEFKKRVKTEEANKLSLLGLAFDCGFNSKSTFNHIFKKAEGITPSQYRNNVSE